MLKSTIIPALIIVALVHFVISRKLKWRWLSYGLMIAIAGAFIANRGVHLKYTGIEVAGIGCLITWIDPFGYWKKVPK